MNENSVAPEAKIILTPIYEEVMWLAQRKNITPSDAPSWYTHVTANKYRKNLRKFTGFVSEKALDSNATLRLEHFKRMQTTLTQLVANHLKSGKNDPNEFAQTVVDCEQVHIVTVRENYEVMKADGDYQKAGILLKNWNTLPMDARRILWKKTLKGRVSNAQEFEPTD